MRVSRRQKKGRMRRKNQVWKGYEVAGGGRRRGCTFGSVRGVCVARGGHAHRGRVEDGACAAASWRRSKTQAQAIDCGQSVRCRLAANGPSESWHRVDLSASTRAKSQAAAGWSKLAAIPATMDRGTDHRLAGQLPPTADSMGTTRSHVPSIHECRMPAHRRETVMKPLLAPSKCWGEPIQGRPESAVPRFEVQVGSNWTAYTCPRT